MRVICVDRRFPHHGQHSGYQMLAKFTADDYAVGPKYMHYLPRLVRDDWLFRFPPFHPIWYTREAFGAEAEAGIKMVVQKGTLFHFLYGEHSFRWSGKINRWAGRRNRIVATYHQLPRFFEVRRKRYAHIRDLDAVILVASSQREFFESLIDPSRVHVIPHGIDTQFFQPPPRTRSGSDAYLCLTVGSNYRNFDLHVQVIKQINCSSRYDVGFVIVGEQRCSERFEGLDNVRYLSGISDDDLLALYQTADILFLPLTDATACNALLEGMACGLPIMVTDVGGVQDYVDESCAVLVPAQNAEAMTDQLLALLEDRHKRTEIGKWARQRAVSRFDWRQIARQVQRVYAEVW